MVLVESRADFPVIHHFIHFRVKLVLVHLVLQQLVQLLLVHELLGLCHLFHNFDYGPSQIELAALVTRASRGVIGVIRSLLVGSVSRVIVVHI